MFSDEATYLIAIRSDAEQPKPNHLKWKDKKQIENENKPAEQTSTQ